MRAKYCQYCGQPLKAQDRLEGCCNDCADEIEANSAKR